MSTNLNNRAHDVTQDIFDILGVRPSGTQDEKVAQAIEQLVVKALKKSAERSTDAAMHVFFQDQDMAHKIADKIRDANKVLITNLSALR